MRFKSQGRKPMQPELVASKDASRPALTKVHLNAEQAVVEVTDSYMLARFPVELDEGDTSGPVPIDALKASRKPPLKGLDTRIRLNGTAEVVMDGNGDEDSAPYLTVPRESGDTYQFPDTERLIPENLSEFEIGLDAGLLLKLAKSMGDTRVRIRFVNAPAKAEGNGQFGPDPLRPMVVRTLTAGDDDPTGILMPIRLKEGHDVVRVSVERVPDDQSLRVEFVSVN